MYCSVFLIFLRFFFTLAFVSQQKNPKLTPTCRYLENKEGYRFGDITRALAKKAASEINKVTGKENYEFGDISRWMDQQAKQRIKNITGKEEYQFGDLTLWADRVAKEHVATYTNKTNYELGDISKEILRRAWTGEYDLNDVLLALRILVSAGVSVTPIASLLPVRLIMDLVNLGLTQDIGSRLLEVLANSLDAKMKQALTGNPKYRLGDITRDRLQKGIASFTGKETYEFGDITRTIQKLSTNSSNIKSIQKIEVRPDIASELADWDRRMYKRDNT